MGDDMHSIDLGKYDYRTDLIIERCENLDESEHYEEKGITVDTIMDSGSKYVTISFDDVTDKDNYKNVERIFIKELKKILDSYLLEKSKILVIGLGNSKSTPDSLGPEVINNILVTRHLFSLGDVEEGYKNVCSLKPQVTGVTGIETSDMIDAVIGKLEVDLIIVVDALAASSITRVNRTIQITDSGIAPGSGVGNNRKELSFKTLGIPVIAIGIPTIVDAATIVTDTMKYLLKQLSYKVQNINSAKNKLINENTYDYSEQDIIFSDQDKEKLLGMLGSLDDDELKTLFLEVLTPVNYNLMVTPKEVDFMMEKLGMLLGNGINKSLHKSFNTTK